MYPKYQNGSRYFLYARKSSESEDRQVQSIDDQITRLNELARDFGLKIVDTLTEAKSAKKPDNRQIFDRMIERIKSGEADGILCWQINRLSRNPIDSARVQWLLQQQVIKSIQTIDKEYRPEDNVLLFNVESGMANQFILDLSKNVKRGNQGKLEKGWRPGMAPIGYLNELSDHTIISDPDRFHLLRKGWDLMLTGRYTVPMVWKTINNDWGFRTAKKRRTGNKPISISGMYRIFTNPFYAGIIMHNGHEYPGKHEKMITMDEFDQVQEILGRKGKPRPQKHTFPFTGMIRCGECGCLITAEIKKKFIKKEKKLRYYTYYHCTRRKENYKCSQTSCVTAEELEKQINSEISKVSILPEFRVWALQVINRENDEEIQDRTMIYCNLQKTLTETQTQLDNLTKMRYRELIDDQTFLKERDELTDKIRELRKQVDRTEARTDHWAKIAQQKFDFAAYALEEFKIGSKDKKREILAELGSNFLLKDQKLTITAHPLLKQISERYFPLEKEYCTLEPGSWSENKRKNEALTSLILHWQAR